MDLKSLFAKHISHHISIHLSSVYINPINDFFTTYYGKHDSPNRIHNIKLVASWIDGKLLMPGDVFSVADTFKYEMVLKDRALTSSNKIETIELYK